ncbi:MAG: YraN family protein [Nitrospinae bacterium]|nr:YraN family protein [Nitrospinota bacterium]
MAFLKARTGSSAGHLRLGRLGEDLAANALIGGGYKILHRNLKVYRREVDIIADHNGTLVFVEVKTRANHSFGTPLGSINHKREKRLREAAELYAMRNKITNRSIRFDVVSVDFSEGGGPKLEIIKNAF